MDGVRIYANTIETTTNGIAIRMRNSNANSEIIRIEDNILNPIHHGIQMSNVGGKVNISGHTINFNKPYSQGRVGIQLFQMPDEVSVVDNSVSADDGISFTNGVALSQMGNNQITDNIIGTPGSSPSDIQIGIGVANAPNTLYCCNSVNGDKQGVSFQGNCNGTKFRNTTFENTRFSMVLSQAILSPHTNPGDDWVPAPNASKDATFNGSLGLIPLSAFKIDMALMPNGYSKIKVPVGASPQDWFKFEGTDPTCNEQENCGEPIFEVNPNNGNDFENLTLTDLHALAAVAEGDWLNGVLRWEEQKYLYEKLSNNPDLINHSQEVTNFYNSAQGGLVGQFHTIEQGIRNLFITPVSLNASYESLLTELRTKTEALELVEEELLTATGGQADSLELVREGLSNDLAVLRQDFVEIKAEIKSLRVTTITQLINDNMMIVPLNHIQTYEQTVNNIYLNWLLSDTGDFTQLQKDAIIEISVLCPFLDGAAIYRARLIREFFEPEWEGISNDIECMPVEYRSSEESTQQKTLNTTIFPNPTKGSLTIHLEEVLAFDSDFIIFDLLGRNVYQEKLLNGQTEYVINLPSYLQSGTYVAKIKENKGKSILNKRLIISN